MRNKILGFTLVALGAMSGVAQAGEFRAPLVSEKGPLRYDLYRKKDKWTLNLWSTGHYRTASRAFKKHGTDTENLASLIFGKESFKISEAFAPHASTDFTEKFNANILSTRITPCVTYYERGVSLGGRFEYPVWKNKGRIGVRATVPFKTIRFERDNSAGLQADADKIHVIRNEQDIVKIPIDDNTPASPAATTRFGKPIKLNTTGVFTNLYRASFVKDLPIAQNNLFVKLLRRSAANNHVTMGNSDYNQTPAADFSAGYDYTANAVPFVVFRHKNVRTLPNPTNRAVALNDNIRAGGIDTPNAGVASTATPAGDGTNPGFGVNAQEVGFGAAGAATTAGIQGDGAGTDAVAEVRANPANTIAKQIVEASIANFDADVTGPQNLENTKLPVRNLSALPTTASGIQEDRLYAFGAGQFDAYDKVLKEIGDELWFMTVNAKNPGDLLDNTTVEDLEARIERFGKESVEQWLFKNDFEFRTDQRTGLGDIDLDFFYEHTFNNEWRAEGFIGVRIPTGGSDEKCTGPYRARRYLGNGNHVEIKIGGNVGWAALDWLNVHADLSYAFALEDSEKIPAAFKGATVKNIGQCVDADVDWGYLQGKLDVTMYHPKTEDFATTIGYSIYYKTEDNVNFKQGKVENTWFGKKFEGVGTLVANEHELDNNVAEKDTEQVAHRLFFESNWRAHKYMNLYIGGAYTFAGQNMPREHDIHCGAKIRF